MTRRIEILIMKDGEMKIETSGYENMACLSELQKIAKNAGLDLNASQIVQRPGEQKTSVAIGERQA